MDEPENISLPTHDNAHLNESKITPTDYLYDRDSCASSESHENSNLSAPEEQTDVPSIRITRSRLRSVQSTQPVLTPTSQHMLQKKKQKLKRQTNGSSKIIPEPGVDVYVGEKGLYERICAGRSNLTHVVDEWIEQYKINREMALIALMQFFISASGCKGKLTATMVASMEYAAIIRRMTEEFDEDSGEYPLIISGQSWKRFRQNYCDFVGILVKQCQYSIIYDQYLMDNLISLFTGLSDSQVRAFRHTATLGAMKLMTALVDVSLVVSINLDNTQRQYNAEMTKPREKRAVDRLEALMAKRIELEENTEEIKSMLTYLFKSVFVHRYRDIVPDIRATCMAEIGVWMKKSYQNFLDDSYLKYIGWTLYDKVGEVRLKCLQALQPLYASEELKGKLELFTSKFKDRIVAMALDKEFEVAVQAVKLVTSLLKSHKDILTDKDCENIYELVYSSPRAVAQAAAEFLNEKLFSPDNITRAVRTASGKKRLLNTPLVRDLVQFFIESELHVHAAYLVDALIDSNEMVKDWECMTDLLLEDPGLNEELLDDQQETSLIEIMTCAVRQASTGEAPVGRGPNRKMASIKEIKQISDDKQKLTEHFIKTLPILLDRFRVDKDKVANLVTLPQYFDLSIYTASRQESNLDMLLKKMQIITDLHQDTDVLEACSKTLEILCSEENPMISARCDIPRRTLIDSIVIKYREAMDEWNSLIDGDELPDDDEIFNVIISIKKVAIFYSCHNLGHWSVWLPLFNDLRETVGGRKILPDEAVKYTVSACYYGIQWDLDHLEELAENGGGPGIIELVTEVKRRLGELMVLLRQMLEHKNLLFNQEAYLAICDLLIVFCNQLAASKYSALAELIYEPDDTLHDLLNTFIQTNVFIYEEQEFDEHSKIETLHKRRNFLASYCKLIVYGVMPISTAGDVFKHYIKSYNEYGDLIKNTLARTREMDKVSCAKTMCSSLVALFDEIKVNTNVSPRQNPDFGALKELAKRFALSFGLDALKNRQAIVTLHRDGILYTVSETVDDPSDSPPNILFLEILAEFTNKLLKQDKRLILTYLDQCIPTGMCSSRVEDWQPLISYRNSLLHGETDQPPQPSRRAYARKKKEVEEEIADEEELSGGENVARGSNEKKEDNKSVAPAVSSIDGTAATTTISSSFSSRPQRQCASRSIGYKFMDDMSDDEF